MPRRKNKSRSKKKRSKAKSQAPKQQSNFRDDSENIESSTSDHTPVLPEIELIDDSILLMKRLIFLDEQIQKPDCSIVEFAMWSAAIGDLYRGYESKYGISATRGVFVEMWERMGRPIGARTTFPCF